MWDISMESRLRLQPPYIPSPYIPSPYIPSPYIPLSPSIVVYEGGAVVNQARSLWRLELARTKWAGGFINWFHPMRIKHITTGNLVLPRVGVSYSKQ